MPLGSLILSFVIIILIFASLCFLYAKVIKRKVAFVMLGVNFVLFLVSFIFVSYPAMIISAALFVTSVSVTMFTNLGDLRRFLANPFKKSGIKTTAYKVEKLFDKDSMYKEIEKATINLSKTRTGAIMTFERNTSLQDVMKNGVPVNAPARAELLETIEISNQPLFGICLWNNEFLFISCEDKEIKLIDLKNKNIIKRISGHSKPVATVKKIIHPQYGECLISQGMRDDQIRLWVNKK